MGNEDTDTQNPPSFCVFLTPIKNVCFLQFNSVANINQSNEKRKRGALEKTPMHPLNYSLQICHSVKVGQYFLQAKNLHLSLDFINFRYNLSLTFATFFIWYKHIASKPKFIYEKNIYKKGDIALLVRSIHHLHT